MGLIRFLLAIAVALAHVKSRAVLGVEFIDADTAVQAFFLISGFYISFILCENPRYQNKLVFYSSRYFRLWPVYAVCSIGTLALGKYSFYMTQIPSLGIWQGILVMLSNITMLLQDSFMFLHIDSTQHTLEWTSAFYKETNPLWPFLFIAAAWSIGIELTFYLIAPFIVRHLWRLILLVLASGAVRYWVYTEMGWVGDPWHYRFMPAELFFFALGGISYHISRYILPAISSKTLGYVNIGAVIIIALLIVPIDLFSSLGMRVIYPPLEIKDPYFLIMVAILLPFLHGANKQFKWDNFIGKLSYPIYLGHCLVASVLSGFVDNTSIGSNIIFIGFTIAFAVVLEVLIERPVNRWRSKMFGARRG